MLKKERNRGDFERNGNVGQVVPDNKGCSLRPLREKVGVARMRGCSLFNLINPSPALRASSPARGEENSGRGFTLIELLVVVLIIGILASVALPQYQRVVQKSQFIKYRTWVDSLAKAVPVYYLNNGTWPDSFQELDVTLSIELPTVAQDSSTRAVCASNDEIYCCMQRPRGSNNTGKIMCAKKDYSLGYINNYATSSGNPIREPVCFEGPSDSFCKTLPGAVAGSSSNQFLGFDAKWKQKKNVGMKTYYVD